MHITHTPSWRKLAHWLLFYRWQKLKSKLKVFLRPFQSVCVCGFVLITSRATVLSYITHIPVWSTLEENVFGQRIKGNLKLISSSKL